MSDKPLSRHWQLWQTSDARPTHISFEYGHRATFPHGATITMERQLEYARRIMAGQKALDVVIQLHREGDLSEGQCCQMLEMERVAFRKLVDEAPE